MSDLDITGRVVFDASQAEGALDKIGDKADQMAREVQGAATTAGKAVDKIGDGAAGSAEKFTRAEGRIADSIKRTQTSLELLGKTASEKLEFKINAQGLDAAKFEPALAKLREIESQSVRASTAASGSLNNIGMSAKATAAAMRGVPAQFTDIVTSIQGGQAPLTVFLQQGGQLKDMFGGAGNAARALGGYVLGLVNPITVAAAAVGGLGFAYYKGASEADAFKKAVIQTNSAAGISAVGLTNMAQSLTTISTTQGAASSALLEFVKAGNVGADSLEKFTASAIRLESVGGAAVADTAKQFAELGKDPLKASLKLNESTGFLTQSLYEQIKALDARGDAIGAAKLAQEEFAKSLDASSSGMQANLGLIEKSWIAIKREIFAAGDALKSIGRDKSMADIANQLSNAYASGASKAETDNLESQYAALKKIADTQTGIAGEKAKQTEAQKKAIEATDALTKANEKALTKQQQMNKALEEYRANLEKVRAVNAGSPLLAPGQVSKTEAAIRDQFKERGGVGAKAENVYASLIASIRGKIEAEKLELASGAAISESQKIRIKLDQDMAAGRVKLTQSAEKNVRAALDELSASEASALAKKAIEKADVSAAEARQKYLTSLDSGLDKIQADTAAQIEATARMGLSKDAIAALDSAKLEMLATDTELQAIKALDRNLDEQTYSALKKQATAYRELAKAKQQGAAKETALDLDKANSEAAKKALQEWEKGLEEVDKLGRDVFASWATEGGNAAEKIGKALKSALMSAIYDATLKKVNVGIYSAIVGDKPGAGGGGGALGAINSASNLNTAYGAASQYFTGASVGASSASLVGANAVGAVGGDALGALIAGNGGWAGVAAGAEAAGAAAGTAAGAGATAGVSAALAAIPVWGWVALAALAVVGLSDGPTSTRSTGYANRKYGADGKLLSSATDGNGIGEAGGVLDGIYKSIAGVQASLGAKGGADITYNSNTGRESKDPQFYLKTGSYDSGEIAKNDANVSLAISRIILTAIQDSELPKYLQGAFDGMVAGSMSQEQINAAITGGQALKTFNDQLLALPFANLADLSFSATQNLIGFSGGLEQLGANLGAYYTNFYSAEEQRAQTVKNINAATAGSGLDAATATREQFRSIVESQDLTTESGQKMYAALLGVSGAFAGITEAGTALSEKMKSLRAESESLSVSLLRAKGDTGAADKAQYKIDTTDLTAAERAVFDYNAELKKQIDTLSLATTQRTGLQDQLNALTDTAAQALGRQRGALDESNLALFDQVQAATKQKEAIEASSEAMKTFNANIAGTIAKFSTPEQNSTAKYTSIADGLKAGGFASSDTSVLVDFLKSATKATIWTLAQQLYEGLGEGAFEAKESLRGFADQLADIKDAEGAAALEAQAEAMKLATAAAAENLEKLTASLVRFGTAANLRVDLAASKSFGGIKEVQEKYSKSVAGIAPSIKPGTERYSQDFAKAGLDAANLLQAFFSSSIDGFIGESKKLEQKLIDSGTGIGKNLALDGLSKYFNDFGAGLNDLVDGIKKSLAKGSSALEYGTVDVQNLTKYGFSLDQLGIGKDSLTGAGVIGIAGAVGDAAALIGKTLNDSLMASVSESVKGNTAFTDLLGPDLAHLSAIISGVAKDDVQGLNDAFLLLTGNFADGKLSNDQYAVAIGLVTDAFKTGTEAAKASAESIEAAYKRLRDATKTNEQIAQEKIGLEDRLYAATDTTAQALERARAAIDPYNKSLFDTVIAAEAAKAAQEEYNGLMTSLYTTLGNTGALRAEQLAKLDPSNRALQSQIFAIDDAKAALQKALQAETESAQAAQQAASERVSTIKSIFDTLKSNVQSLYETVEATKMQGAQQANAFIDNALVNARATGYLPESDALNDAISGARGGLDKQYVSDFERQRDTLVLAGKLAELQDISGGQLTIAEQQLKAAEDQVEGLAGLRKQGQDLLDSLSGNTAATLSIVDAIAGLSAAVLGAGKAAPDVATAAATKAGVLASEASGTYGGARPSDIYAAISAAGSDSAAQALAVLTSSFNQGVDKRIYDQYLTGAGFSSAQDVPGYIDFLRGKGVPGFAGGGMHSGGLRWVGENGPELEATGPSRIWNAQQLSGAMGGGNNSRLEALIEGLTKQVQTLQAELVAIKTNTGQMAEQIDEVTEGGNAMRSRAVGVTA